MKANMGMADKAIRLMIAIVLIVLFYKGVLPGILGIIGLVVALLLTVTSLIGICPVYKLFKIDTTDGKKTTGKTIR